MDEDAAMNGDDSATLIRRGDVFLTRSQSLLGKAIRFFERGAGEERAVANHTGLFVAPGDGFIPLFEATSIEALSHVRMGCFWDFYHGDENVEVAVYRDITLTPAERIVVTARAYGYRGDLYGGAKIVLHALDWMLERALDRRDVYFFRRVARIDRYPICSYLVAKAYADVGRNFGVAAGAAQPDDIWDFVQAHPEKWGPVLTLRRI